jgi:Helix-turn-helix domain
MPGYDGSAFERPGRPGPRPGYGGGAPGPRPGGGPRPRWTPSPGYPGGQRSDDFNAGADWNPGRQYLESNGRPIPPRADRLFRNPVPPGAYRTAGPGAGARPGAGMPGAAPGARGMPGAGMPGQGQRPGMPGYGPGPAGFQRVGPQPRPRPRPRPQPQGGQYQGGAQAGHGGPPAVSGQVIRQRDNALPEGSQTSASQPIAAIAPDGLDAFARDLRALRGKAELDYEEMAERSHYTMKTLASAAGGLRLPTLPVAIAYVRACDGDIAEWEDRWHKLAEKITAEAARKQADGEAPPEPAQASDTASPQSAAQQQPPAGGQSEVYVITSAKPRQPDW